MVPRASAATPRKTICPGIYSQINVSGNASLTLNPGIYIIEGGGLTVSGNASISGTGVMIYNAGSNYPSSGGNFGGITLSGNGTFSLSAPTSGPYAGVLIFQSRQNTRALSFSGNAMAGMVGTIYAANALLSMSGNAALQNPLVVGTLNLSGNVTLTQIGGGQRRLGRHLGHRQHPAGRRPVGVHQRPERPLHGRRAGADPGRDQCLGRAAGPVQRDDHRGQRPDAWPTSSSTSAPPAPAAAWRSGVLGCFNAPNSEITMIQGWNWYAGADPTQIGAGQYDFETTVTHELGHALGLGGSTEPELADVRDAGAGDDRPDRDRGRPQHPRPARRGRPADRQGTAAGGSPAVLSTPPSANDRIMVLDAALAEWFSGDVRRMAKNKLVSRTSG